MIPSELQEIEPVQLTDDVVDNEILELNQNEEFEKIKQEVSQEDINKIISENINFEKLNNPDEFMADQLLFAGPITTGITKLINPVIRKSKEVIEEGVYPTLKEKFEKPVDLKGAADVTGRTQRGEIKEEDIVDTAEFINKVSGKTPDETDTVIVASKQKEEREIVLEELPQQDYENLANSVNGINLENESIPQKILPNLDYITVGNGTIQQRLEVLIQEAIKKQKELGRENQKVTVDSLIKEADAILSDSHKVDEITSYLMQREKGDKLLANSEALAARNIHVAFQLEAIRLSNIALETDSLVDKAKAHKAAQIAMIVTEKIAQSASDSGLTLFTHQIPVTGTSVVKMPSISDPTLTKIDMNIDEANVEEYFIKNGGKAEVLTELTYLQNLPLPRQKSEFLDKLKSQSRREAVKRSLVETYQSALLSSPITHSFNIVGTASFIATLMIERALQEPIRTLQGKSEAFVMLKSLHTYFPQMIKAFAYGALTEKSLADAATKLDAPTISFNRQGFRLRNRSEGGDVLESFFATLVDGLGIMTRLQGIRPMIATDEFFKAAARGMEIDAIAHRQATQATEQTRLLPENSKLSQEKLDDVLNKKYQEVFTRVRHSKEAFEQGAEFARMATFQDALPSQLNGIAQIANKPIIKIFFPFFKSPTQIVRRLIERSPLALLLPGETRRKIFNNKKDIESIRQKKEALTRIALGTGTGASLMMLASGEHNPNIMITGYGPADRRKRGNWLENHEPYSIGIRKDIGEPWTWVSYARYEPIAGVLAMAADTAQHLPLLTFENPNLILDSTLNLGLSIARYPATALPMLQFVGELFELTDNIDREEPKINEIAENFISLFLTQSANAAYIVARNISSLGLNNLGYEATKERSGFGEDVTLGTVDKQVLGSEVASQKIATNQYKEVTLGKVRLASVEITREFYKIQNNILARTLGGSSKLPPLTNHWLEPTPQSEGKFYNTFLPLKISTKPSAKFHNKVLSDLGYGINPHKITHYGVRLNNEQFSRFKELYNYPDRAKFKGIASNLTPAKSDFTAFLEGSKKLNRKTYLEYETREDKQQAVNDWHNERTKQTRELLFEEYPELKRRKDLIKRNKSKGKDKPLEVTSPSDRTDLSQNVITDKFESFLEKFRDRQGE
tara:strand:- start:2552 stop:5977 length:3426 start_codon:yes stop_codon:yes gene_type:complete